MIFGWDESKNRSNQRAIGAVSEAVLLVVHVHHRWEADNGEEIIRIISAREADSRECRVYLERAVD